MAGDNKKSVTSAAPGSRRKYNVDIDLTGMNQGPYNPQSVYGQKRTTENSIKEIIAAGQQKGNEQQTAQERLKLEKENAQSNSSPDTVKALSK